MQQHQINNRIMVSPLTVIGADGTNYGQLAKRAALDLAEQTGLDLVLVQPERAVAKLMDYGKYCYEEKKKTRARENDPEAKRREALTEVKEIGLSYKIAEHDLQVLVDRASRFIAKGHRVKFGIKLRGREARHHQLATDLLNRIADRIDPKPKKERPPFIEGNRILMVLVP